MYVTFYKFKDKYANGSAWQVYEQHVWTFNYLTLSQLTEKLTEQHGYIHM